jgi:UPF0716 protein FxsA
MRALLVVVFIVVPVVELAILIQVGEVIGLWWTIAGLVLVSVVGAWLVRREGTRAWARFRAALSSARVPTDEVLDGALVLFGGALLLTPGFATDTLGLLLMFPPSRALVGSLVKRQLGARFSVSTLGGGRSGFDAPTSAARRRRDDVVDVEVVSVEREHDHTGTNGDINSRRGG